MDREILHEMKDVAMVGHLIKQSDYVKEMPKSYRRILFKYIDKVNNVLDNVCNEGI